ncbi:MAG: NAD(P)/FAD-dependent oxidoreductase [Bacteriovoracia bacterium]
MGHSVLILGAGFAGLNAAKVLGRKGKDLTITVLDRRNYHLFQPLLYQVAMAGLSPADIASPIRSLLADYPNVNVLLGAAKAVRPGTKEVTGEFGTFSYDYLLVATGAQHSYFGHDEWEKFAPGLKTLEQATEIRRRVLSAYEFAERETDPAKQKSFLTFVVIGGGPTGVELAGALGEISRYTLRKEFRRIDPSQTRVILIEAGPRILAGFEPEVASHALRDLENLGVSVWTSTRVTKVSQTGVEMGAETLHAATVIWAAGVKPSELNQSLSGNLDRSGRVPVEKDLSLPGHPEVFVVGDQAHFEQDGKALPGLAPVAIQAGRHAAENILRLSRGEKTLPFRYKDKGQMATIGRSRAVVQMDKLRFYGFFAWLTWITVHIYYLIGFKNRLFVVMTWIWAYVTYGRSARLIVQKEWQEFRTAETMGEKK